MLITSNYPIKNEISADYEILLNGEKVEAVYTRVSAMPFNRYWPGKQRPLNQTELASYISFSSDNDVEITVIPKIKFNSVIIRPLSADIKPFVEGEKITFTCPNYGKYTLELDGPHNALHIFSNPIIDFEINEGTENTLYFGPGVHEIGHTELTDNTTVYIDKDSVVYGSFYAVDSKNIRILGYGVLDGGKYERKTEDFLLAYDYSRTSDKSWEKEQMADLFKNHEDLFPDTSSYIKGSGSVLYKNREQFQKILDIMNPVKTGLSFYACENIEVNGIIFRNSAGLTNTHADCENVHYNNVKIIGNWRYNSDGIDFYNCRYCSVKNSFIRTFDDCVCAKGQIGWDTKNTTDILVENCVLWNDWGKALEVGVDTVAPEFNNIVFRNCDCIHNLGIVLDVGNGDRPYIHNVLFEDIRVEYSEYDVASQYQNSDDEEFLWNKKHAPLVFIELYSGVWSNDNINGSVSDITFKNIKIYSDSDFKPQIELKGLDAEHNVNGVIFDNITINGKPSNEENFTIETNEFVEYKFI